MSERIMLKAPSPSQAFMRVPYVTSSGWTPFLSIVSSTSNARSDSPACDR